MFKVNAYASHQQRVTHLFSPVCLGVAKRMQLGSNSGYVRENTCK
jgi:hypothetical protein